MSWLNETQWVKAKTLLIVAVLVVVVVILALVSDMHMNGCFDKGKKPELFERQSVPENILYSNTGAAGPASHVLSAANMGVGTWNPSPGTPNFSDEGAQIAMAQVEKLRRTALGSQEDGKATMRSKFYATGNDGPAPHYVPYIDEPILSRTQLAAGTERMKDSDLVERLSDSKLLSTMVGN